MREMRDVLTKNTDTEQSIRSIKHSSFFFNSISFLSACAAAPFCRSGHRTEECDCGVQSRVPLSVCVGSRRDFCHLLLFPPQPLHAKSRWMWSEVLTTVPIPTGQNVSTLPAFSTASAAFCWQARPHCCAKPMDDGTALFLCVKVRQPWPQTSKLLFGFQ